MNDQDLTREEDGPMTEPTKTLKSDIVEAEEYKEFAQVEFIEKMMSETLSDLQDNVNTFLESLDANDVHNVELNTNTGFPIVMIAYTKNNE